MIGSIIAWLVLGIIAGAIAKLIMPGKQGGGIVMTIILGIVGAVVGGPVGAVVGGVVGAGVGAARLAQAVVDEAQQRPGAAPGRFGQVGAKQADDIGQVRACIRVMDRRPRGDGGLHLDRGSLCRARVVAPSCRADTNDARAGRADRPGSGCGRSRRQCDL